MRSAEFLDHVCHLHKTLYGLKQAPTLGIWSFTLSWSLLALSHLGLIPPYLFIFGMDLGALSFFCGFEVCPTSNDLLLSQQKYVIDLLSKHYMLDSKPVSTPIAAGSRLTLHDGSSFFDATKFQQVVGSLQHLRMTHSDISFAVNKLSQFIHVPSETHWGAVKHLLRYLNGTRDLGIRLLADTPLLLMISPIRTR
ncbi:hypothetical protein ZIOFF_061269 [Zingiber officinale]|uniref:Uncharacterized protein n=1 Tax=Zingiber officinale TaxID=94328 RepID=A0A8J5KCI4_ZINOF|nr:hypothetical protein ZIOFF_061269 [Zingiber officinale]